MAHYIVTGSHDDGADRQAKGFMFITVPPGNNDAGVPWTQVAVGVASWRNRRKGNTGTAASVPVDATTQTALDGGTLFEQPFSVTFPVSHTPAQAVVAIEAGITAEETQARNNMASDLRYYGFEGDT